MPRDRRYSTSAWQKTRLAILARDGYQCGIRGPRCRGIANSVHHRLPSSQFPHLFFASDNLVSACTACNSGEGSQIASDNRANRATVDHLEQIIERQNDEIAELYRRLAELEQPRRRPMPSIA